MWALHESIESVPILHPSLDATYFCRTYVWYTFAGQPKKTSLFLMIAVALSAPSRSLKSNATIPGTSSASVRASFFVSHGTRMLLPLSGCYLRRGMRNPSTPLGLISPEPHF